MKRTIAIYLTLTLALFSVAAVRVIPLTGGRMTVTEGRIQFGTAVDTNTILLLHFDEDVGVTNFVDSSTNAHPVLSFADGAYATNFSVFGNAARFSAAGYLTAGRSNAMFNFTNNIDFTIDMRVYYIGPKVKTYPGLWSNNKGSWTAQDIVMRVDGGGEDRQIRMLGYPGNYSVAALMTSNVWNHVAVVRAGTNTTLYINGTNLSQTGLVFSVDFSIGGPLIGGGNWDGVNSYFNGFIDELRVSRTARWTNNFTPPKAPYAQ